MKNENIDFYNSAVRYLLDKYKIRGVDSYDMSRYKLKDHTLVLILCSYHASYGKLKEELIREVRKLKIKLIKFK